MILILIQLIGLSIVSLLLKGVKELKTQEQNKKKQVAENASSK